LTKLFFNKKFLRIEIILVIILSILFLEQINPYYIENNHQSIIHGIKQFSNNFNDSEIIIRKEVDIDNKKFLIFNYNENFLGVTELTKGFLNKYKIEYLAEIDFADAIISKTDKSKYLIVRGKNYNKRVASIRVFIEGKEYLFDISTKDYFIVYQSVNEDVNIKSPINVEMYDNNISITNITHKSIGR